MLFQEEKLEKILISSITQNASVQASGFVCVFVISRVYIRTETEEEPHQRKRKRSLLEMQQQMSKEILGFISDSEGIHVAPRIT